MGRTDPDATLLDEADVASAFKRKDLPAKAGSHSFEAMTDRAGLCCGRRNAGRPPISQPLVWAPQVEQRSDNRPTSNRNIIS